MYESIINIFPFYIVSFSFASTDFFFFKVAVYVGFFLKKQKQAGEQITLF